MTPDGLATAIGETLGVPLRPQPGSRVHGGSINECYRWEGEAGPVFVKLAPARSIDMFEAEAAGLDALRAADAVRVPRVLSVGTHARTAWLALEWIQSGISSRATDCALGEQLARQHRSSLQAYGWSRNNTIGSTPQLNGWEENWVVFFRERRLGYQLRVAEQSGYRGKLQQKGSALLAHLEEFFSSYRPAPSLLHGDLWGGNRIAD